MKFTAEAQRRRGKTENGICAHSGSSLAAGWRAEGAEVTIFASQARFARRCSSALSATSALYPEVRHKSGRSTKSVFAFSRFSRRLGVSAVNSIPTV
jgi:hypothetical protein